MTTGFSYCECPDCEFSVVVLTSELGDGAFKIACPLCEADSLRLVAMVARPALDSDRPEGTDARRRPMPRYTCSACGRVCLSSVSEEESVAEFERLYGRKPDPETAICDDCFKALT